MVFQQYPVIEELEEVEEDDIFETQVQIFFVNVKGITQGLGVLWF